MVFRRPILAALVLEASCLMGEASLSIEEYAVL